MYHHHNNPRPQGPAPQLSVPGRRLPALPHALLPVRQQPAGSTHIDHVLVRRPNIVLSVENVTLTLDVGKETNDAVVEAREREAVLALEGVHEASLQPFASSVEDAGRKGKDGGSFSSLGRSFRCASGKI